MLSRSRLTITILGVMCGILGCVVLRQRAELLPVLKTMHDQHLAALKAELGTAREALAKVAKQHSVGQQGALGGEAAKAPTGPVRAPVQISDIIKDHPEFAKLYSKSTRRQLRTIYGAGLNSLNIPPQQLNRLKDLLAERQMSVVDATQAAGLEGLRAGSPEWQQAVNQAALTGDQEIKDILGANAEATLTGLKSSAGHAQGQTVMEGQINLISSDFVDAGVPLTTDQSAEVSLSAFLNAWHWPRKRSIGPANRLQ